MVYVRVGFFQAYQIAVRDLQQPMLVSRPKKKDQREGAPELLYLLPELCIMTGITDEMRNNFSTMRSLATVTKLDPNRRAAKIAEFRNLIQRNEKAQARLKGWGVEFARDLVGLTGRSLPPETIYLGPQGGGARKTVSVCITLGLFCRFYCLICVIVVYNVAYLFIMTIATIIAKSVTK